MSKDTGENRRAPRSGQGTMRAVAKRQRLAVFATAPGNLLLRRDLRLQRPQTRALVRSIAERLGLGPAAGAEPVGARRGRLNQGGLLKNVRFAHGRRLCANPCLRATRETTEACAWTRTSPLGTRVVPAGIRRDKDRNSESQSFLHPGETRCRAPTPCCRCNIRLHNQLSRPGAHAA